MSKPQGLAAYIAVTAAYWAFMLSDGALRMLVLLHFHKLGFSPVQLAYLFILYEVAGIVTNLSAGWLAKRFGLNATLYAGLSLQILALIALTQLNPSWSIASSVAFVMLVQGLSGIAKDLAKMSSKSAVKLLAPSEGDGLFRWVAVLTGSKNAIKGLGFALGGALLATLGYVAALWVMAAILGAILLVVILRMPSGLPAGKKGTKFLEVFSTMPVINWLSGARVFLFGARDVWFVVGIPIYFYSVWSDGTVQGNRQAFFLIGSFMAAWIIFYGAIQASAPRLLRAKQRELASLSASAPFWVGLLLLPILSMLGAIWAGFSPQITTGLIITGLLAFGGVFAVNSALHSYLILAFSDKDRVTLDVGFYYMANAAGRLMGTLLSGVSYQLGGLPACLMTAGIMIVLSWLATRQLSANARL